MKKIKNAQIKLGWLDFGQQQKLQIALVPLIQRSLLAFGGSCIRDVTVRVSDDYRYVIVDLEVPSHVYGDDELCAWTEAWAIGFASGILVANEIEVIS